LSHVTSSPSLIIFLTPSGQKCEHEGGIVSCYIITIIDYISHTIRPKMWTRGRYCLMLHHHHHWLHFSHHQAKNVNTRVVLSHVTSSLIIFLTPSGQKCEHEGGIVSCYIITDYISHTIRPKMWTRGRYCLMLHYHHHWLHFSRHQAKNQMFTSNFKMVPVELIFFS
jgi:cytosine/adenosine deaminase-related metal-dependent hydrolase